MGHELGHYVLNHVYEMLIMLSIIVVIGFAFVNSGFHVLNRTFGGIWGVRDIADPAGLIKWLAKDRCLVTLGAGKDIKAKQSAFEDLVREWIRQV